MTKYRQVRKIKAKRKPKKTDWSKVNLSELFPNATLCGYTTELQDDSVINIRQMVMEEYQQAWLDDEDNSKKVIIAPRTRFPDTIFEGEKYKLKEIDIDNGVVTFAKEYDNNSKLKSGSVGKSDKKFKGEIYIDDTSNLL